MAKLADPAVPLRPTARRVLRALRDGGPQRVDQLAARLSTSGRRPIRSPWVLARMGGVTARSLTSTGCSHVHLTSDYHVGSARVQLYNHSEANDPNYTGLRAI